ncbi:hypothetical protein SAMN02745174_02557 [Cetobacterium ceti]|uniref:Uncharacterized protein n=1 Tax=Cetobacterium ceti TaxID=180163 RepID=A0A1T4R223_9FUSO|nr:hypothetical protein [Cetobacterium ceti]SKA10070.1 hypothetical protein SAMN02745174_02557 [Cetobacterium ceti]
MKTDSIVSQTLSLTMATTGILYNLTQTVKTDYKIDELDDERRNEYIEYIENAIAELNVFKSIFKNKEFNNFVNKFVRFLKNDLEKQLHYENLSDQLRDILHNDLITNKRRLEEENQHLETKIFTKDINCIKLKNQYK